MGDDKWKQALDLAKDLIRVDSSAPEGKAQILMMADKMLSGVATEIVNPEGVDPYLVATTSPSSGEPSFNLILEGHLDTVAGGTMEEPFVPFERQDKLYGRGAADMKGGCAALITAMNAFARLPKIKGQVQLVLVTDEETQTRGILHALTKRKLQADLALIAEPTQMQLAIAHKGIEWVEVSFRGRPAHASTPEMGLNAIEMASCFITAVKEHVAKHYPKRRYPVCGLPTINIGTICGGEPFPNIVPEACTIKLDRRWNPNEIIEDVWHDLEECLEQCRKEDPAFNGWWRRIGVDEGGLYPPLSFPLENPHFEKVVAALKETGLSPEGKGLCCWTEGSLLQMHGIPSLVLGPGCINQAHSAREFIRTSEITKAAEFYFALMKNTCL